MRGLLYATAKIFVPAHVLVLMTLYNCLLHGDSLNPVLRLTDQIFRHGGDILRQWIFKRYHASDRLALAFLYPSTWFREPNNLNALYCPFFGSDMHVHSYRTREATTFCS